MTSQPRGRLDTPTGDPSHDAPPAQGPMFATNAFAAGPLAARRLHRCLFQPDTPVVVTGPDAGPLTDKTGGITAGPTTGGNASLLAMLADTGNVPPGSAGAFGRDGFVGE